MWYYADRPTFDFYPLEISVQMHDYTVKKVGMLPTYQFVVINISIFVKPTP